MGAGQYTIRVKGTLDSTAIQKELNRLQQQAFTVGGGGRGKGTAYGAIGKDAQSAGRKVKTFNGFVGETEKRVKRVSKPAYAGKFSQIGKQAQQNSKAMKGFGQQTLDVTKKVIQFGAVTAVIRGVTSGMADMVQNVFELDASLTEFKKVSDLSAKGLEKYTEQAYKAGRETARTGTEMIDAAT